MCFRENNNAGSKRAYKWACKLFHDVNLTLYTETFTPRQDWEFTSFSSFRFENIALFTVASIHRIRKCTKKVQKLWNKMEDKRKFCDYKAQAGQKTDKSLHY